MKNNGPQEASETEVVCYVDSQGKPTGETAPKLIAHNAHTRLHSAFSCYIFNYKGQLLVTQRALSKKVWPGVWTNSVCGHPGPNEKREDAVLRRTDYELGMKIKNLRLILPSYIYKTPPFKGIIEHEFCPVFVALMSSAPKPNPEEVEDYKWMNWQDFVAQTLVDQQDTWSWWCKDQIKQLEKQMAFKTFLSKLTR